MDYKKIAQQNRILEVRCGSHLFGTNTPDSDEDFVGIFMPNREILFGFQRCEEVKFDVVAKDESGRNTADAVDRTLHEYRKFCRLALQNNPNILHILFADNRSVVYEDMFGRSLREMAEFFPHRGCFHRFISYAVAQKHKMVIRGEHFNELQKALDILNVTEDNLVLADLRERAPFVGEGESSKYVRVGDLQFEAGVFVKKARKMVRERLAKATNRVSLMTKYGFDVKYGSNLIHLLKEGIEILTTGRLTFPLSYAQEILDIKQGKYTADEILEWSDDLESEARAAFEHTQLREHPEAALVERFVIYQVEKWLFEMNGQGWAVSRRI